MQSFTSRLKEQIKASRSLLCVGLDISPEALHAQSHQLEECKIHAKKVVDATKDIALAYKPNLAFFERWGSQGFQWLEELIDYIGSSHIIIGDAKRGDIGNTARQYAESLYNHFQFDAVTINPYMGRDTILPFLENPAKGVFVLARTSNNSATDFQNHMAAGDPVYVSVAKKCMEVNTQNNIGMVVGATALNELELIRKLAPEIPLLIPGIGTQGGNLEASITIGNKSGPAIINISRAISFPGDFTIDAIRTSAELYVKRMRELIGE